jgi:hypothetical protein
MAAPKKSFIFFGAVFIFILSVFAFVYIPMEGGKSSGNNLEFGKWNGKPIEYVQDSYFIRQMQQISEQMQSQGQEINKFSYYQIMQTAFNSAVVRLAILEQTDKAGYKVPQSLVDEQLIPYYVDSTGKYSAKIFADTPETTKTSRRNNMTEDMTAQRYIEDTFGSKDQVYGLKTSSKEIELLKTMSSPERSFTYASFETSAYPDTEVVAFGQANAAKFVKHNLSIITVDSEATAKKVLASLAKKGITFEDAVTTYSTRNGSDASGKLTKSFYNDLTVLFTDAKDLSAVIALTPGTTSQILKTGKTFAIVRCDGAPVNADFTDATTIAAVKSYMEANERGKIEDYFLAKAKSFAEDARKNGFDAACKTTGVVKESTTAFGINYGNVNIFSPVPVQTNADLAQAPKSESFFNTAFSLKANTVSDPILLGSNVVVLQLAEEKAADPQILEMLPMFYNYYASSWSQNTLSESFLKSKKLEDHFMQTYLKNFLD